MVTHRVPRLASDDRVVFVADGRIIEQGSHGELLGRLGMYSKLVTTETAISSAKG